MLHVGLQINETKTYCRELSEGVDMLGYHFSDKGKSVPTKAVKSLQERLETMCVNCRPECDKKRCINLECRLSMKKTAAPPVFAGEAAVLPKYSVFPEEGSSEY